MPVQGTITLHIVSMCHLRAPARSLSAVPETAELSSRAHTGNVFMQQPELLKLHTSQGPKLLQLSFGSCLIHQRCGTSGDKLHRGPGNCGGADARPVK